MDIKEYVIHTQENGKYKIQFERSAVKGQDGFKVEVNGDDALVAETEARALYDYAVNETKPDAKITTPEVKG